MRYIKQFAYTVSKHKALEICYYRQSHMLFAVMLHRWNGDHKGFSLEAYLLGHGLEISLYDTRHEDAY